MLYLSNNTTPFYLLLTHPASKELSMQIQKDIEVVNPFQLPVEDDEPTDI
jgi:hypothetical protein